MNKEFLTHLIALVVGASSGALVTKYILDKKYKEQLASETAEIRRYYTLIRKSDGSLGILGDQEVVEVVPSSETEEVEREDGPEMVRLPSKYIPVEDPRDLPETINIFGGNQEVYDLGPELDGPGGDVVSDDPLEGYTRLSGHPYIISQYDFFNTNEDWEKATITYYLGDKVVLDEREYYLTDSDQIIGDRHLNMFGVLSDDPMVVYVRNERLSQDFEIIAMDGKYSDLLGPDE